MGERKIQAVDQQDFLELFSVQSEVPEHLSWLYPPKSADEKERFVASCLMEQLIISEKESRNLSEAKLILISGLFETGARAEIGDCLMKARRRTGDEAFLLLLGSEPSLKYFPRPLYDIAAKNTLYLRHQSTLASCATTLVIQALMGSSFIDQGAVSGIFDLEFLGRHLPRGTSRRVDGYINDLVRSLDSELLFGPGMSESAPEWERMSASTEFMNLGGDFLRCVNRNRERSPDCLIYSGPFIDLKYRERMIGLIKQLSKHIASGEVVFLHVDVSPEIYEAFLAQARNGYYDKAKKVIRNPVDREIYLKMGDLRENQRRSLSYTWVTPPRETEGINVVRLSADKIVKMLMVSGKDK